MRTAMMRTSMMRTSIKALMLGIAACALASPASAYTINGVIPAGTTPVVINLRQPIRPGLLRFRFYAPPKNAGVPYAIDFCIGPAFNPCGLPAPTSHVINVPKGQVRSANFDSGIFATNVFVVGQGTRVPVPYSVQVY
jgi:hypothetical protein